MEKVEKYITSIFKKEIETGESIQWDCYKDILKSKEVDDGEIYPKEIEIRGKSRWGGENYPMKIDEVTKILDKLKKSGCNYVEMMHHSDHGSYIFNGVLIRESTPEEIEKDKMLSEKRKEVEKEIKIYEDKIRDIKKKYNDSL
jgi:hypothetical protein